MAPLAHMVFRQSRILRDVIVMSCMLDLAREDVSTALDLYLARAEGLLRAGVNNVRNTLPGNQRDASPIAWIDAPKAAVRLVMRRLSYRIRWPSGLALLLRRELRMLLPTLVLVGWFSLPMTAVAGVCAALLSVELRVAAP